MGLSYGSETGLGTTDIRITTAQIVRSLIGILGIVFVVLIILSGVYYLLSKSDPEKVAKAKKILLSAIIGLIIILMAYALTSYILNMLIEVTGPPPAGNQNQALANTCEGDDPENAYLCDYDDIDLTQPTTKILVSQCTDAKKCEYYCNSRYILLNNSCQPNPYTCQDADIPNATLCVSEDIDLAANTAKTLVSQCTSGRKCEYVCNVGYIDINNICQSRKSITPEDLFNGSAGPNVADFAFYTEDKGGVDDYNNNGVMPVGSFTVSWTGCAAGNNYCNTNDSVNADTKDESTNLVWSKWLDNGTSHTWFWANNCYDPGTPENPGTCAANGDDACQCVKKTTVKTGCEALGNGWRLPYQKEYPQAYIDGSWGNLSNANNIYWSATNYSAYTNYAWAVYPSSGFTYSYTKPSIYKVRCVFDGGTLLKNLFNGSAGSNVADYAFYTQDKGGVDDFNKNGAMPGDSFTGSWTVCAAGNNYCNTNDSVNADAKDDSTNLVWSKWLDGGTSHTWFWANNCYEPGTPENPDGGEGGLPCNANGDDACRCIKKTAAKTGCEAMGAGWRLPYQKEYLQAYIDGSWGDFSNANNICWSATTASGYTAGAYWNLPSTGHSSYYYKTTNYKVRCVFSP